MENSWAEDDDTSTIGMAKRNETVEEADGRGKDTTRDGGMSISNMAMMSDNLSNFVWQRSPEKGNMRVSYADDGSEVHPIVRKSSTGSLGFKTYTYS